MNHPAHPKMSAAAKALLAMFAAHADFHDASGDDSATDRLITSCAAIDALDDRTPMVPVPSW